MLTTQHHEVQWALAHFPANRVEHIRDMPWSQLFRLHGEQDTAYLKVVPNHRQANLAATVAISEHFPQQLPKVLAFDADTATLLLQNHGGESLLDTPQHHSKLLQTYAHIQAHSAQQASLLNAVPACNTEALALRLQEFLNSDSPLYRTEQKLTLDYFLGKPSAAKYYTLLSNRLAQLQQYTQQAQALPLTLNHGDLRLPNAAIRKQQVILFDWDEASIAPAGLSLHSLFGGCTALYLLAHNQAAYPDDDENHHYQHLLQEYIHTLQEQGYSHTTTLEAGIPAAACLGVMQYIISFADYPVANPQQRQVIAENIRHSLDDLLRLSDFLALANNQHPLHYVQDYLATQYYLGAENTLGNYLQAYPEDHGAKKALLQILLQQNKLAEAETWLADLLKQEANEPELLLLQGNLYADRMEFEPALRCYTTAAIAAPDREDIRDNVEITSHLHSIQQYAAQPHNPPTIDLPPNTDDALLPVLCNLGAQLFNQYGTLVIKNLFPAAMIEALRQAYYQDYALTEQDYDASPALFVGDKRYMLSLDIRDAFNQPELYASPFLLDLLGRIYQGGFILGSFTSVNALAGAEDQGMHKDQVALFPDPHSNQALPCFATTVLVPLAATTVETGGTRLIKGSQNLSIEESLSLPSQEVFAEQGDCLLFNYQLTHQGMANRSQQDRPVISMVYQRPWFRDSVNFNSQPPIRLSPEEFQKIPEAFRPLFAGCINDAIGE